MNVQRRSDFFENQKMILDSKGHHLVDDSQHPAGYKVCVRCQEWAHTSGTGTAFKKECKS